MKTPDEAIDIVDNFLLKGKMQLFEIWKNQLWKLSKQRKYRELALNALGTVGSNTPYDEEIMRKWEKLWWDIVRPGGCSAPFGARDRGRWIAEDALGIGPFWCRGFGWYPKSYWTWKIVTWWKNFKSIWK